MWNNVRQLNAASSLLSAAALLALLGAAGYWLSERPMFALRAIQVEGDVDHINAPTIRASVIGSLRGSFFTVNLDRARAAFESMPWVRHASVRRVWPNGLAVSLEEYKPLGTWGDDQLVSVDGDLFTANQAEINEDIPEFSGPPGSEKLVVQRYRDLQKWLAPLGTQPEAVTLSARYAWSVRIANGLEVELGRERTPQSLDERTQRHVKPWPQDVQRWGNDIDYADLRYPNGLAIKAASMRFTQNPSASKGNK